MRISCFAFTFSAILSVLLAAASIGGEPVAKRCKPEYFITRDQSPWQNYTNSWAEEQAGKTIAATDVTQDIERVPHLASFTFEDTPLLAIDRANKRVVVSSRCFSEIHRPDVTNLPAGEEVVMGRVVEPKLLERTPELVEFLLESQLIETYHHLEASLKCIEQNNTKTAFTASFTGRHVYYTNDRNEASFAFRIRIDKKTGEITLTGLAR